jgi:hypothetical protein
MVRNTIYTRKGARRHHFYLIDANHTGIFIYHLFLEDVSKFLVPQHTHGVLVLFLDAKYRHF